MWSLFLFIASEEHLVCTGATINVGLLNFEKINDGNFLLSPGICFVALQRLPRHYNVFRYPLSNFLDDGENELTPTTHFNVGELMSFVTQVKPHV